MNINLKDYLLNNWNQSLNLNDKETIELLLLQAKADRISLGDFINKYMNSTIEESSYFDILSAFYSYKDDIIITDTRNNLFNKNGLEKKKLLLQMYGNSRYEDDDDDALNY
ncbi:MAG: hypothetical protein IJH20_04260 [Bacilli bacterium]|nr:hypothetical protein [Bacilli bacterium]